MDLRKFLLIALTTLSLALAGCHEPADGGEDDHLDDNGGAGGNGGSTGDDGDGMTDGDDTTDTADVTLTITSNAPTTGTAGETVTFTIESEVTGDVNGTSDHGGIHFWTESQADDSVSASNAAGASTHATVIEVPGTFSTNWTLPQDAGTYYYRAHLRFDGVDYWGPERQIVVE